MMNVSQKKIAFCITCMNRLTHIQETLVKNMEDNFLPEEVEFVLLDYNSSDGLEKWCKNLEKYRNKGIFSFFKTTEPETYNRSHSRNMAFRLANAEILCNLDADNFLGKGFAEYIIDTFQQKKNIFCTSTLRGGDTFGRVCVKKNDFIDVYGYNESFIGYGFEDLDLYDRLIQAGIEHVFFHNADFHKAISHSNEFRLSKGDISHHIDQVYVSYVSPCKTDFLLFYKDKKVKKGTLLNNMRNYYNPKYEIEASWLMDERSRIILDGQIEEGIFSDSDIIQININNHTELFKKRNDKICNKDHCFYQVNNKQMQAHLFILISDALNYEKGIQQRKTKGIVNPNGFGKGIVHKTLDNDQVIILT